VIEHALEFIRKSLEKHLDGTPDVVIDSARKFSKEENPGAIITLINVQEETALRNTPHIERRGGQTHYVEPPVYVNLFLLFAFDFQTYATSLAHLSDTLELFQSRRWFSADNAEADNPFPPGLEKLVVEVVNLGFEELNNLWGVLGGTYLPSIVCKVRLVKIQAGDAAEAPEVQSVGLSLVVP
jgi:hypothetical protein